MSSQQFYDEARDMLRRLGFRQNAEFISDEHLHEIAKLIKDAKSWRAMTPSDMAINQGEIRIIHGLDNDGVSVVSITYTAEGQTNWLPSYFNGLAMFEMAKIDFLERWANVNREGADDGE